VRRTKAAQTKKLDAEIVTNPQAQNASVQALISELQEQVNMYSIRCANLRSQFAAQLADKDETIKNLQAALLEQSKVIEGKAKPGVKGPPLPKV
jgi:predicted RNase H-like nuclease (RuvC/YqgF family)